MSVFGTWDFEAGRFADEHERDIAAARLCGATADLARSIDLLSQALCDCRAKSIVRLGDIEAAFLCLSYLSDERQIGNVKDRLWFCGIDQRALPSADLLTEALRRADLAMIQTPHCGSETFWGATYHALQLSDLLKSRSYLDVHAMYYMFHDGHIFKCLAGKRVAIVGAKAAYFHDYFYQSERYRCQFPFLQLDAVDVVEAIITPDIPDHAMNNFAEICEKVRATYEKDIDVYLFSCGILAKYLAVMVAQENGCCGWDIGNSLEMIMGLRDDRAWLCGPFLGYRHPEYELLVGSLNEIIGVQERSA